MTYAEIMAHIEAYNKRYKDDLQIKALIAYRQADLIASLVGKVFGGTHQPPSLQEAFPAIFPEMPKHQQNWEIMKARIEEYAAAKRAQAEKNRGEVNGDDT